jgi:hypothetical protein
MMSLRQVVVAFAALLIGAGPAAADDSARNKEGFWTVGRGSAKSEVCMASLGAQGGAMFILRASAGEVAFVVGVKSPMRRGKKGVLATDAYSFDFAPAFNDEGDMLFFDGVMNDRALAALKLARALGVTIDGRTVLDAKVEGTGLENAIEAVIACSKGQSGWWGPGVEVQPVGAAKENDPGTEPPLHKDGFWTLEADGDGCSSAVRLEGGGALVLIAMNGGRDIMVGGGAGGPFKRGRKGRFETDAYVFDFKPTYEGKDYMQLDAFLDDQALFALRRAKWLQISVDGRPELRAELEGTGLPDLLTSLQACASGKAGWWGEGATQR